MAVRLFASVRVELNSQPVEALNESHWAVKAGCNSSPPPLITPLRRNRIGWRRGSRPVV